jgi:hypothetical protein
MQSLAFFAVLLSAVYLLALGVGALARPRRTAQFLGQFAQTLRAHAIELALRIVAGVALVVRAPHMHFERVFGAFGLALIGTSIALAVIPWRLHQRFARWVVPQIARQLPLIGVSSLLGGLALLGALLLPGGIGP